MSVCRRLVLVATALLAASTSAAGTVTVLAAASLSDAFRAIARDFEAAHPGTDVSLSFAGSSTLVRQIVEGAPADVFAAADEESMQKIATEVAGEPQVFARNRLAIVVAKGNAKRVTGLADLSRPGLTIALAAPVVPAGRYALEAFDKANVPRPAGTNEVDVKAVVNRVATGEADAGIAFTTDAVRAAGSIEAVPIPDAQNVVARYPIVLLKGGTSPEGGRAFVAFVLSPAGRRTLTTAGFLAP